MEPNKLSMTIHLQALLVAISVVESNQDDAAVERNRRGAIISRGRYQLSAVVWREHSGANWLYAHEIGTAGKVALMHVDRIRYALAEAKIPVTPVAISGCWNMGIAGYVRAHHAHRVPAAVKKYADKVFKEYKKRL